MKTFPLCSLEGSDNVNQFLIYDPVLDQVTTTYISPAEGFVPRNGGAVSGPIVYPTNALPASESELINRYQVESTILDSIIQNLPTPVWLRGGWDQQISGQIHLPVSAEFFDASAIYKGYIFDSVAEFLPLIGYAITGPLVLHSTEIDHYDVQTSATLDAGLHCVPKIYVDYKIQTAAADIVEDMFADLTKLDGDQMRGNPTLEPQNCTYPELDEVVSRAWLNSFLNCVLAQEFSLGEIIVDQVIADSAALNLDANTHAILDIDFAIMRQNVGGGTCTGRDYPFTLMVEYVSANGLETYQHNFYYNPWGSLVVPHSRVRQGWAHFTLDLMAFNPPPNSIKRVILRSSGFEWKTLVDNVWLNICRDPEQDPGIIQVSQTIDNAELADLNCDSELTLEFDAQVLSQQDTDRPLTVRLDFTDANGKHGSWMRNFFHKDGEGFGNNVVVKLGKWEHYEYDLSDICPCVKTVHMLTIMGGGYGYEVEIDNIKLTSTSSILVEEPIPGFEPNTFEMNKTPPQQPELAEDKPVVVSADVKIKQESDKSTEVPFSVEVDYTDQEGVQRTHKHNVSTKPFDHEYHNAKETAKQTIQR